MSLDVVAMGDHNAVDVAQQVHESILEKGGCLLPTGKLTYGFALPAGDVLEGAYIDDRLVVGRVPRGSGPDYAGRDTLIVERSRKGYIAAAVPLSDKSFDFQNEFIAWGTEAKCEEGMVGAPRGKLLQLMCLGLATAAGGLATKSIMQSLL